MESIKPNTEIGKRLKVFRVRTNTKMPAIAKATGIPKENLYKWEKGTKCSDVEQYNRLVAYLDEMEKKFADEFYDVKLFSMKKVQQSPGSLLIGIYISQNAEAITLSDESGIPGNIIIVNEKPVLVVRRNDCSIIGAVDGLIQVTSECLDRRYTSGSWIAVRKLKFHHIINDGYYYYVIDSNLQATIGKVRYSTTDNSITWLAENAGDHVSIKRYMRDVLAIFSIEAGIIK